MEENFQCFSPKGHCLKVGQDPCQRRIPPRPSGTDFQSSTFSGNASVVPAVPWSNNNKCKPPINLDGTPRRQQTIEKILASIPRAAHKYSEKAKDLPPPQLIDPTRKSNAAAGLSILERIRSHLFDFISPPPSLLPGSEPNSEDEWNCDASCNTEELIKTKFPKETRFAMSNLSVCKQHKVVLCPSCLHSLRQSSKEAKKPDKKMLKIPCPKNILCDRGIHYGDCADNLREKVNPSCICDQASLCKPPHRKKFAVKLRKPMQRAPPPGRYTFANKAIKTTKDVSCNTSYQVYKSRHADIAIKALDNLRITIDEYIPVKMTAEHHRISPEWQDGKDDVFHDTIECPEPQTTEFRLFDNAPASGNVFVVSNLVTKTFSPFATESANDAKLTRACDIYSDPIPSISAMHSFNAKSK